MSYDELLPSPLLPNGQQALSFANSYALYDKFCKMYWNPVSGEWQKRIAPECLSPTVEEAKSRYNSSWDDDYCVVAHNKETVLQMDRLLDESDKMRKRVLKRTQEQELMDKIQEFQSQDMQRVIRKMEQRVFDEMEAFHDIPREKERED